MNTGVGHIGFEQPLLLLLFPLIAGILWIRKQPQAIPFPFLCDVELPVRPSARLRFHLLPEMLRASWLALVVVCLAGPNISERIAAVTAPGLACHFVVDVSGSMEAPEWIEGGKPARRLDIAKELLGELLTRASAGPTDGYGAVAFSRIPTVVCPPTSMTAALLRAVDGLEVDRLNDQTNVGDALALAIDGVLAIPASQRWVVLLTDGAHNVAEGMNPGAAARVAQALGVRVFTVAVGSPRTAVERAGVEADRNALRQIAAITGGNFFAAEDRTSVGQIANALTAAARDRVRPIDETARRDLRPSLLFVTCVLVVLETVLRSTWLRIAPT